MPLIIDHAIVQEDMNQAVGQEDMNQDVMNGNAMAHHLDMDDLFGADPVALPTDKRLPQALVELTGSGCCRKVAWSKYGPIASISPDLKSIDTYALIRDTKTGKWHLSNPYKARVSDCPELRFKHLEWSWSGYELAALDASGRVFIFNCSLGHEHVDMRRDASADPTDELSAVVGFTWLAPCPQSKKLQALWGAAKEGGKWKWNRDEVQMYGPVHPMDSKIGLLCLIRGGRLRLLYQDGFLRYHERSVLIDDGLVDLEYHFTHASFCADEDDGMFLVTYDTCSCLRLYKIKIVWNWDKMSKEKAPSPTILATSISANTYCKPDGSDLGDGADISGFGAGENAHYVLTYLEMIPAPMDQKADKPCPSVLTIFKNVSSMSPSFNGSTHAPSTLLWSHNLIAHPPAAGALSTAFDQLAAKKKSTETAKSMSFLEMRRHSSTSVPKDVLSVTPMRFSTILCLACADGSFEWLDHATFQPIQCDYNYTEISSWPQSGFVFANVESVVATDLSPNGCVAAYQSADGALKIKHLESTIAALDAPTDDDKRWAIATCLALQWTSGLLQYRSCLDDVLALIPSSTNEALVYAFLEQCHSALEPVLELASDDAGKVTVMFFRQTWLQKLLGAHCVLGSVQKKYAQSLPAKLAHAVLNLRTAALTIMMVFRVDGRVENSIKPDTAVSVYSIVKWTLDFMVYMLQEIDRLSEHLLTLPSYPHYTMADINAFIAAENSPALLILCSTICRVLLRVMCCPLRHGWVHMINRLQQGGGAGRGPPPPHGTDPFQRLCALFSGSAACSQNAAGGGQPLSLLEQLTADVDAGAREAFAGAAAAELRPRVERDLYVRGALPDCLLPAVRKLVDVSWPQLLARPGVDLGAIIRLDVAWLGVTEDVFARRWQERHVVDVLRKVVLVPGKVRVRWCVRCGIGSEDILPGPQWHQWVMASMKNCVCMGNWGVVDRPKVGDGDGVAAIGGRTVRAKRKRDL